MFKRDWWKYLSGILLFYAIIVGFMVDVPHNAVNLETMRNLFYHVGMWFGMFSMLITGFIFSLRYLRKFKEEEDLVAVEAVNVGLIFGLLGFVTGMLWGKYTWGVSLDQDPKLIGAAVGIIMYLAYLILRGSLDDVHKRAKVSAVYNIFAFFMWIVFVLVRPRLGPEGIHPKNVEGLSFSMRIVFFPAMIGWTLLAFWIMSIRVRIRKLRLKMEGIVN